VCNYFYAHRQHYPNGLEKAVADALASVEKTLARRFGDPTKPLLVSVRSGARESMPGMMDTVLNLGLNDRTVEGLAVQSKNPRFAYDSYRRFVQMYADVVLGIKSKDKVTADPLTQILDRKKLRRGVEQDTELTADDLRDLVHEYKEEIRSLLGKEFPEDPYEQLWNAIGAVFGSWNNDRAIAYRELYHIPHHWGTAVNIQAMVFGNLGDRCATGVTFTRDPATGDKRFYGEFLVNAQGEDVVAGIRTPKSITELQHIMPASYNEIRRICRLLEKHFREMQDIEFTIQDDKLWVLQTRTGKRTGFASLRIAVDMVAERIITKEEALLRVEPDQLNQLLRPISIEMEKRVPSETDCFSVAVYRRDQGLRPVV
jgi:pyruvate,orthophosphate dikinase